MGPMVEEWERRFAGKIQVRRIDMASLDPEGPDGPLVELCFQKVDFHATPTLILLNRQGRVVYEHVGPPEEAQVVAELQALAKR
jgi:hypothetical protein